MNIERTTISDCMASRLVKDKERSALLAWLGLVVDNRIAKPIPMSEFNIGADLELQRLFTEMCHLKEVVSSLGSDGSILVYSLTQRGELSYSRLINVK